MTIITHEELYPTVQIVHDSQMTVRSCLRHLSQRTLSGGLSLHTSLSTLPNAAIDQPTLSRSNDLGTLSKIGGLLMLKENRRLCS